MALLPTNQIDQIKVGFFVVCLALVGAYWNFFWLPKNTELTALRARIDSLTAANDEAKRETDRGDPARLRAEADEYGRMLGLMRQLVPTANEVPTLINNISTAARRVGLDLGPMEPMGVVSGDVFDTHKWKMSVTGPYHRVAEFLTNVGSLTRIVAPMNLSLVPTQRQTFVSRRGEQMLDANFEIQTYVAKTGLTSAAAGAQTP